MSCETMSAEQIAVAQALGRCTFLPASDHKRFARDMDARSRITYPPALTERQSAQLARLAWRYRRQMPSALVPAEEPA